MSLVSALSQAEKLQLNVALSASMQKGSTPSSRKGKPASLGTRAWTAFVDHAKATWPERFASPSVPGDRLVIAGAIRLEDPAAYAAFCAKFKEEHSEQPETQAVEAVPESQAVEAVPESQAPESQAVEAAPESQAAPEQPAQAAQAEKPEKPKRVISEEQKAKMKAGREAAKAKKDAAAAADA